MELKLALEQFQRYLKRRGYSEHTISAYLLDVTLFFRDYPEPVASVEKRDIDTFIEHWQSAGKKATTINRAVTAVKMFYEYLIHIEELPLENPVCSYHKVKIPKTLPRVLREPDVEKLMDAVVSIRDKGLFYLMLRSGLRVSEVAKLETRDVDLNSKTLLIRKSKRMKDRQVYISEDLASLLERCLKERPMEAKHPYFFWDRKRPGKGISIKGIQKMIERLSKKKSIDFSSHILRHTCGTELLEKDTDITTIQNLLGHETIQTTLRYTRVSNEKVKQDYMKAMNKILKKSSTMKLE